METGLVFGLSIGELLTIYDPDSQSWKMSGCLFTGDYAKFLGVLPKSGLMENGLIYEQATWVRRTGGKESGLWPTPQASDNRDRGNLSDPSIQRRIQKGKQIGLSTAVKTEKTTGMLNPHWTAWLMGYPLGWTDFRAELQVSLIKE